MAVTEERIYIPIWGHRRSDLNCAAMSNRYPKSLKLDGVLVGEYLGSDDQDEDIEAARDMLRAKGLYNPPSLSSAMLGQANAFAYVAYAACLDLMKNRGPLKPIPAAPFVVNAAFSVELYLKTLHVVTTGSNAHAHKLLDLYDSLPDTRQTELQDQAVQVAAEHGEGPQVQLRTLMTMLNDAFVRWRYVYELPRSGIIHLQQTILVMHACRDVCERAVKHSPIARSSA